jgi:hydroxymethylbilane synthase
MSGRGLILAAHGSRHLPRVNRRIADWAAALARVTDFDQVAAAFHQGDPNFDTVIDRMDADDFTIVPVMTSRGYYADRVLPAALARNARYPKVVVRITEPVGPHPAMADLAATRLREIAKRFSLRLDGACAVIAGHGTPRHIRSRQATLELAERVRARVEVRAVRAAFIDDTPSIAEARDWAADGDLIVMPFMMAAGPHATVDIPTALGLGDLDSEFPICRTQAGARIVCDQPLGEHEAVRDIIHALATAAPAPARHRPRARYAQSRLRAGTRGSALARWQTDQFVSALREAGHETEVIAIETLGDRVRDRAIRDLPGSAPFAADIESALQSGAIDFAVHSYKDLDSTPDPRQPLVAFLPRGDAREALVSRDDRRLADLPAGAVVGTSSPRRAVQILGLRSDLRVQPIRGPVEERVRQVRTGAFDAAVLALAGLQRLGLAGEIAEVFDHARFVPAPGQAAIVAQTRRDHTRARDRLSQRDHRPTRIAAELEMRLLHWVETQGDCILAAHARVHDTVDLRVRLLRPPDICVWEKQYEGAAADDVERRAIADFARVTRRAPAPVMP